MDEGQDGPGLTPLRRKIIGFIGESLRSNGYPPSLREIGEAAGLASTSSVAYQMSVLQATGYVSREPGRPRTAVPRLPGQDNECPGAVAPGPGRMVNVPLVGRIAAGTPVIADQMAELAEEVISLPKMLTGEGHLIALRVAGDSMTGAAIADGDWVVVRQQPNADSGDIVAAMLPSNASPDWEATVKTLKKADGHISLIPHNPAYTPILADSAVIIGKVVSVLRRLLRPGEHARIARSPGPPSVDIASSPPLGNHPSKKAARPLMHVAPRTEEVPVGTRMMASGQPLVVLAAVRQTVAKSCRPALWAITLLHERRQLQATAGGHGSRHAA